MHSPHMMNCNTPLSWWQVRRGAYLCAITVITRTESLSFVYPGTEVLMSATLSMVDKVISQCPVCSLCWIDLHSEYSICLQRLITDLGPLYIMWLSASWCNNVESTHYSTKCLSVEGYTAIPSFPRAKVCQPTRATVINISSDIFELADLLRWW